MGEHKHPNKRRRVCFVCLECGYLAGKTDDQINAKARWYLNVGCDICGRKKTVVGTEDWGFFTTDQVTMAKSKLRELGLDRRTFAVTEDVKRLISVVDKVLGTHKSEELKALIKDLVGKLNTQQPIEMYYAKQLTYLFTHGAAELKAQQQLAAAKKKPSLVKKAPDLVVVEGGQERPIEAPAES